MLVKRFEIFKRCEEIVFVMKEIPTSKFQAPACLVLSIVIHSDGKLLCYMNLEHDPKTRFIVALSILLNSSHLYSSSAVILLIIHSITVYHFLT